MKRLLLDTHVFLWWLSDNKKLKSQARASIAEPAAVVHVSAAAIWEIAIKAQLGKIDTGGEDLEREIAANGFVPLPITPRHALTAGGLPLHHDDPFDRMLIAQAQEENLTVVTHDKAFEPYGVPILRT